MRHRCKHRGAKLGLVLPLPLFALSASLADAASALTWVSGVGGIESSFTNGQEETVHAEMVPGTEFVLKGQVGSTPLTIKAKDLVSEEARIKQLGTTAAGSAKNLTFSEITLVEPKTSSAPLTISTGPVKSEIVEVPALTSGAAAKFLPETGTKFKSFKLSGSCAIAGTTIELSTSNGVFGEVEAKGMKKVRQPIRFSPTINSKAGGNLFTGANAAKLTGEGRGKLSGSLLRREWGFK